MSTQTVTKKLKILLYVNNFLPKIGGKEIVVFNIAKQYKKMGHDVRIVGPAGFHRYRKKKYGFPVHRYPVVHKYFRDFSSLLFLCLDICKYGCDVVHAHTTNPSGYIAALLKKIIKFPLIITPHGSDIHIIPELGYGQMLDKKLRKRINIALENADVLTAISKSIEESLVAAGADRKKICMVPNGVSLERFGRDCSADDGKQKLFDPNKSTILVVGNYRKCKGHENVIKAMPEILKEMPSTQCLLVGMNNNLLEPLVRELGLQESIIIYGAVKYDNETIVNTGNGDKDTLAQLYAFSTVYVSAGIEEGAEGMSLAVLEAMAAGLPVVATDISGNRDLIDSGKNGILVEPANHHALAHSILSLLKDRNRLNQISLSGRNTAEKYGWENIAHRYLNIYEEAMEKAKW